MVEAITEKYGDITEKGDPRFLEARMTSRIEEFIPVDTGTKYSADAEKLYVWFVYDNFNKDEIKVEWVYLDDDYSIHTFAKPARISVEAPSSWKAVRRLGAGDYSITAAAALRRLDFSIIEGATVVVPLPFENGKITLE